MIEEKSIKIDAKAYYDLRTLALREGRKLKWLISKAVNDYVKKHKGV